MTIRDTTLIRSANAIGHSRSYAAIPRAFTSAVTPYGVQLFAAYDDGRVLTLRTWKQNAKWESLTPLPDTVAEADL